MPSICSASLISGPLDHFAGPIAHSVRPLDDIEGPRLPSVRMLGSSARSHACFERSLLPGEEVLDDFKRLRDDSVPGASSTNAPLPHSAAVDDWSVPPPMSSVPSLACSK